MLETQPNSVSLFDAPVGTSCALEIIHGNISPYRLIGACTSADASDCYDVKSAKTKPALWTAISSNRLLPRATLLWCSRKTVS
ncbi:hypothetical protein KM043_001519 [Ampulex compressa]|nr:hypothetical protein KM043_001519 [Ampulex compressa]